MYFDPEESWHETLEFDIWSAVDDWNYDDFTIVWEDEEM